MQILILPDGSLRAIYSEDINLAVVGRLQIRRGSHVEPDSDGRWIADLSPCQGPVLGPYALRSEALAAEQEWLENHWLIPAI